MLLAAGIAHACCRHVPPAGRAAIKAALDDAGVSITTAACTCVLFCAGVNYGWIEVNAQHAFIRDEMSKVCVIMSDLRRCRAHVSLPLSGPI